MPGCRRSLVFAAPRRVEVHEEPVGAPGPGEVVVQTTSSAISAGTELLVYRDRVPPTMALDASIPGLTGPPTFPMKYGYAAVGRVVELGYGVDGAWEGRRVFCLHPHESHFVAGTDELAPVPAAVGTEDACFLASAETAVTFVMDGRPIVGERVAVFGQGVVGLLTTALLARFPLEMLVAVDRHRARRELALALGAHRAVDPQSPAGQDELARLAGSFDLTYELSGTPAVLDAAIAVTGRSGRVVIGSWYGVQRADVDLGGAFHRSRMRLISSQVSTIDPRWSGRWDRERRRQAAWRLVEAARPGRLVTHRVPLAEASAAYELLDRHPEQAVQVLLCYHPPTSA
ncbi:MAG: zinc-binding alcohol dehydrogenase [Acidimicrobiia bacterium]|nr:zinc-binding alcohol dehydrogenase [Acidimicrobiia bacterium]